MFSVYSNGNHKCDRMDTLRCEKVEIKIKYNCAQWFMPVFPGLGSQILSVVCEHGKSFLHTQVQTKVRYIMNSCLKQPKSEIQRLKKRVCFFSKITKIQWKEMPMYIEV